ncbi:adenylate/guanylate cyclase domain-containing protein [Paraliomyxa miuraensis]|uniref:adenylate/guanylate cyclase domain-containing protein n=1 Tax=Paraliomyxa miuraensis TaxID=376150 RepID=UPI00224F90E5|nr:adenylate/guanylate cyclase domain-containing protein [Paraliomyxa miuraensis]MCX4247186.1 AAA family ATPase [Paraliomyxa miuraensis]
MTRCPSCSATVEDTARFCSSCGTRLQASAPAPTPAPAARTGSGTEDRLRAERRQLTVMFCDIADSTKLSEQLDPEDLMAVVRRYQSTCAQVIERFGGSIAQYLGDGLLVYFGYPTAFEDAPTRAARAGLEMLEALDTLNEGLERELGVTIKIRLGIHTGLVVVGEVGGGSKREQLAVGDTANIAARLESLAGPNSGVVSEATRRLIGGLFQLESLGKRELKGIATPMEVFRLLRVVARHRLEAVGEQALTPFVGRAKELEVLRSCWEAAGQGRGSAALVVAEPGVGKSRMLSAFKATLGEGPYRVHDVYCMPFFVNSAMHPIVEMLRVESGIGRHDAPARALERLRGWLEGRASRPASRLADAEPLLAALLDIPPSAGYEPAALSPQARKLRTTEVLVELLLPSDDEPPRLLVLEDVHWIDPSTLDLVKLLVTRLPERRVMVLMTARPVFQSPWTDDERVHELRLRPFSGEDSRALVLAMTEGLRLPPKMLAQVVERTDGIPLFVEELTRMLMDAGQIEDTKTSAIPATLHDSLMARLDRIDPLARKVAQLGATIGRTFDLRLLEQIFSGPREQLERALDELVESQLVLRQSDTYIFKHALIQDVAYESLLKRTRQEYHGRIAKALEEGFGEQAEVEPELLAHHLEAAGGARIEDAVDAWLRAAERAQASSSNQEAVSHLQRGLALVPLLPESPARDQLELRLQIKLGTSLSALKGYASEEVEQVFVRADALCGQLGSTPERFWVLWGLWAFYLVQGTHTKGLYYAERMLELATEQQDEALLLEAHFSLGLSYFFMGDDLPRAREHLEWVVERFDVERHGGQALLTGQSVGVTSRSVSSLVCFQLGALDLAITRHEQALALSAEIGHEFSRAYALGVAAWFQLYMRDHAKSQAFADEAVALSQEQSFGWWLVWGTILGGSARAGQGEAGAAERIQQCIGLWRQTGSGFTVPYFLGLLSDARRSEGHLREAGPLLDEALELAESSRERFFEAELRRMRGTQRLLQAGDDARDDEDAMALAEASFRRAIETARAQGARSWQLRAATSLAELLLRRGQRDEARAVLEEALGPFEGQPRTPDLVAARALLES